MWLELKLERMKKKAEELAWAVFGVSAAAIIITPFYVLMCLIVALGE